METESDRRARDEEIARQMGRIAVDIDAVMARAGATRDRLEPLDAVPVGDGFLLEPGEAEALIERLDARYADVVRPCLKGEDIPDDPLQSPSRWIIDFGARALEGAERYPVALAAVRQNVKPERDRNRDPGFREHWWRLGRHRPSMRKALEPLPRYLGVGRVGKRTLTTWCQPGWLPSEKVVAIALDGDEHFGVMTSAAHTLWAHYRGSTLKADPAYTPTTVFETFPWPDLTDEDRRGRVASAARRVVAERAAACDGVRGLTAVYNLMEEGGFTALAAAHHGLDLVVAAAYGWPAGAAADPYEVIPRLMALNREIGEGHRPYDPFGRGGEIASEQGVLYLPEEVAHG